MAVGDEGGERRTRGEQDAWQGVRVPNGCILRSKQAFEYTTAVNLYDLTLYQNQDGTWYAIALPREGERVIIYGSNVVPSAQMAIQVVIDKIHREGLEAWSSDGDASDEDSETQP